MQHQSGGRRHWERHAANYDRSMALFGGPLARMAELAAENMRDAARVLEVGAGTGLVTAVVARSSREVVAIDYAAMVARVERRVRAAGLTNVRGEQADLYDLRFDDHAFDAVVAANLLHMGRAPSARLSATLGGPRSAHRRDEQRSARSRRASSPDRTGLARTA